MYPVDSSQTIIDPDIQPQYAQLVAGDTLLLLGEERGILLIRNLHGALNKPITITNEKDLHLVANHHFGISISHSSHIRLTGSGDPQTIHGIEISHSTGNGIGATHGTSHIEIDHILIRNINGIGIQVKTDATCSAFHRDEYRLENIHIHHNKLSQIGGEGFYIGSSYWQGREIDCSGAPLLVFDPMCYNTSIHHNELEFIGWDGIQVSTARNSLIFENTIFKDSRSLKPGHMSGIFIGGGSSGKFYNNTIEKGYGAGISVFAKDSLYIYNNLILDLGDDTNDENLGSFGIYLNDKLNQSIPAETWVFNNLVTHPQKEAIHINSTNWIPGSVHVHNNALIDPGKFPIYASQGIGHKAYVNFSGNNHLQSHQYTSQHIEDAEFKNLEQGNYHLKATSPLIEAGKSISFDFAILDKEGITRPQGSTFDIGPFEAEVNSILKGLKPSPSLEILNPQDSANGLVLVSDSSFTASIQLFDLKGNQLLIETKPLNEGVNYIQLPAQISSGVYIVQWNYMHSAYSEKVVLLNH